MIYSLKHLFLENCSHEDYSKHLEDLGFRHPSHEHSGLKYTNIHGKPAQADADKPYGLFIYKPSKGEQSFETLDKALGAAPEDGDWQIVNMITGEIYKDAWD